MEKYYKAYDKRYKQVHEKNLSWSSDNNTKLVYEIIKKYRINKDDAILEIGCGEGRDAKFLLKQGYNILATDVSVEAIKFCKLKDSNNRDNYLILDVLNNNEYLQKFDFIYSIACVHMFTEVNDRNKYYKFIKEHLKDNGIALILSMGDGNKEVVTNPNDAWKDSERIHQETGKKLMIASTSCKIVSFKTWFDELEKNNLIVTEHGITQIVPDFPEIMYVVIKK